MTGPVISHYLCPVCGEDWADTWQCACNSQCPGCGLKDIEPTPEDMEMQDAFQVVLDIVRENGIDTINNPILREKHKTALGLVTAYSLLNVKG